MLKNKLKRFICFTLLVVMAISGNVYASGEIEIGTDVYNLVTTFVGDAGTMRGFAWSAETDYTNMAISYAKESDGWANSTTKNAVYEAFGVSGDYEPYPDRLYYKVEIGGLEAGTTYVYKIGDTSKDVWSKEYKFTTEAADLTEFSFIGVADPQRQTAADFEYYTQTLNEALTDKPNAAFMVNLGDMVEYGNLQEEWDYYFGAAKGIIESLPHMAVVGNHETRGTGSTTLQGSSKDTIDDKVAGKHFSMQFNNPDNGAEALGDIEASSVWGKGIVANIQESVYSFDYGNAHFAVLNSGTDWKESDKTALLTEQAKWLREDLNNSNKKWKIVMVHIGLYPVRTDRYDTRAELLNVIDECGVDLVLSGHDHMVARTYVMRENQIVPHISSDYIIKGSGTVYNILGTAANAKRYEDYDIVANRADYLQVLTRTEKTQPTYSAFDVSDEKISVITKQLDGTVLDEYSIVKSDLDNVEIDAGTDEVVVSGVVSDKSRITVLVTYPDAEKMESVEDICYVDQLKIEGAGTYSFKFGDRAKTYGEYKIFMNISGIASQYGYGYQPKIYLLDDDKEIENLSDISGDSLTAKAEIINIDNGRLYCAQYCDGRLVDVDFVNVEKGAGKGMTISYKGNSQVDEIKLFFWDYTSATPSVEPVIIY